MGRCWCVVVVVRVGSCSCVGEMVAWRRGGGWLEMLFGPWENTIRLLYDDDYMSSFCFPFMFSLFIRFLLFLSCCLNSYACLNRRTCTFLCMYLGCAPFCYAEREAEYGTQRDIEYGLKVVGFHISYYWNILRSFWNVSSFLLALGRKRNWQTF